MNNDERIRKLVLQLSGVFYEIKEDFLKKLSIIFKNDKKARFPSSFKSDSESAQQMIYSEKISEKIIEDLTSSLLKESIKTVIRFIEVLSNSLELSLNEFKNRLEDEKKYLNKILADKNALIKKILVKEPKFKILALLEEYKETDLKTLKAKIRISSLKLISLLKTLRRDRYIQLFKEDENLKIVFKNAPWCYEQSSC